MKKTLDETLQTLDFDGIGDLDRGSIREELEHAIAGAFQHISRYPYARRKGKTVVEARKITLEIELIPQVTTKKRAFEGPAGQVERDVMEVDEIVVTGRVISGLPKFTSSEVRMLAQIKGGRIVGARFNPSNNDNPRQLEFDDIDP